MLQSSLFIVFILVWSTWLAHKPTKLEQQDKVDMLQGHLKRLWQDIYDSLRLNKIAKAERSLLALLKLDTRNVKAYNRLGVIYSKQGMHKEAIECFEIAYSLDPSASSLHNLGLVYLEAGKPSKAAHCFEQAIDEDPENSARHITLAKVLEKMGEKKHAIKTLEKGHQKEPGKQVSLILANAYNSINRPDLADQIKQEANTYLKLGSGNTKK